jgi:hypothetical protein
MEPPYPPLGPFPVADNLGYAVAIAMLLKSCEPGRYASYQQFEMIRKLSSGFSNAYMTSIENIESLRTVGGNQPKLFLNNCPMHSLWFERFFKGCLSRMGQVVKQDMAVSLELIHAFQENMELEWSLADTLQQMSMIAGITISSLIAFCGSFWGQEVFLVDLYSLA